jgi:hypothetical protein
MVDSAPPPNLIGQVRPARVKLEETVWAIPPPPPTNHGNLQVM